MTVLQAAMDANTAISIHTPTRGVTVRIRNGTAIIFYFNPHSHKGSDKSGISVCDSVTYFNPHSHKGSDANFPRRVLITFNFNPHSHKGSDRVCAAILKFDA